MKTILLIVYFALSLGNNPKSSDISIINIAEGWASNSINTVIFRNNSIVTYSGYQYASFYNVDSNVVLAKRKSNDINWVIKVTPYKGDIGDAHNSISLMVDKDGYLYIAWNNHDSKLNYFRSVKAGSLELTDKMMMTGIQEDSVLYPQFYKFPNDNLLFLYRYGASGKGNLVINNYDVDKRIWSKLQNNLIDGEGRAIYVGLPAKVEILNPLLDDLIIKLSINKDPDVSEDVMARQIDKNHVLYLNVSSEPKEIQMKGNSRSILFDKDYSGNFIIAPYEPEFIEIK